MKKDFVYFFKHNNINAIKIGKTSGESVLDRFNSFRTYAPFGAEIIGFFETDDGHRDERELHKLFKDHRLQGEFFDISLDIVKNIIFEKNKDYQKAAYIFNEWIADTKNDYLKLIELMSNCKPYQYDKVPKEITNYLENTNYQNDILYPFTEEYNKFLKQPGFNVYSKIAFKKNLEYFCRNNGFKLITKRQSSEKNKHYFMIKS
jgi:hypothetical protein